MALTTKPSAQAYGIIHRVKQPRDEPREAPLMARRGARRSCTDASPTPLPNPWLGGGAPPGHRIGPRPRGRCPLGGDRGGAHPEALLGARIRRGGLGALPMTMLHVHMHSTHHHGAEVCIGCLGAGDWH